MQHYELHGKLQVPLENIFNCFFFFMNGTGLGGKQFNNRFDQLGVGLHVEGREVCDIRLLHKFCRFFTLLKNTVTLRL